MSLSQKAKWLSLAVLAPLAAHAYVPDSTFQFYYEGPVFGHVSTSPNFVSGDLSVSVTAFTGNGAQAFVSTRWDGLGVISSNPLDVGEINSSLFYNPGDYLVLTFNQQVNLTGLRFSMWENDYVFDGFDHATLTGGGTKIDLGGRNNDGGAIINTFTLPNTVGTTFAIQAVGAVSSFRLAGINATAAVPEPSTYALMGLGLVGMGLITRRRKA